MEQPNLHVGGSHGVEREDIKEVFYQLRAPCTGCKPRLPRVFKCVLGKRGCHFLLPVMAASVYL